MQTDWFPYLNAPGKRNRFCLNPVMFFEDGLEIIYLDLVDALFTKLICYQSSVYLFTFWFIVTTLVFYDTCDVA